MNREQIVYNNDNIYPSKVDVLKTMGISKGVEIPEEVEDLYARSLELYKGLISPKGIFSIITKTDFEQIYIGENQNEPLTPLPKIYSKAKLLALYAFTLGKEISDSINQLMKEKDYPLGFMLDRIASESVDKASAVAEKQFTQNVLIEYQGSPDQTTLLYSPGYCGWHISAQKKIFEYLKPEKIGVVLNESFLMTPIKSVSGVLVSGERDIHVFKSNFSFCKECTTFTCRERMQH